MSIKITRDDHEVLFIGIAFAIGVAIVPGIISYIETKSIAIGILWELIPISLWVLGWFVFHLTRPEK